MSLACSDIEELMSAAYAIVQAKDKLAGCIESIDEWLNADAMTSVVIGDSEIPSLRKLIHDIDERESAAAQEVIDEGLQNIFKLKTEIEGKISQITDLTFATPIKLASGANPTVNYDKTTGEITLGIPVGEKGETGPQGQQGQAPYADVICCGGATGPWLTEICAGNGGGYGYV